MCTIPWELCPRPVFDQYSTSICPVFDRYLTIDRQGELPHNNSDSQAVFLQHGWHLARVVWFQVLLLLTFGQILAFDQHLTSIWP
jgi:hypothetical protein